MTNATPETTSRVNASERLRRLNELVAATPRVAQHWLEELIGDTLDQDPAAESATCPRYAGIVSESGDYAIKLADTISELADELANGAASAIPITPSEMVDLDTGDRYPADLETRVSFRARADRDLVLVIINDADATSYRLASNEQAAVIVLDEWAREHWPQMPTDPAGRVGAYFDRVGPRPSYETRPISAP